MLQNKIYEFEEKHKVDFNQLLLSFEQGMSRAELSDTYGVTELPLRKFLYSLGLEFIRSKRAESITQFTYHLGRENGEDMECIEELSSDLRATSKDNVKLHQSLIMQRDNNVSLRRQVRELTREDLLSNNILERFSKHLIEHEVNTNVIKIAPFIPSEELEEGLCVVFSDEHLGEVVNPSKVAQGGYNYLIAEARIQHVVKQVLLNPQQSQNLNVMMLLDSLKGLIHGGAYNNEEGFTTAVIKLVELYSGVFETFSNHYEVVNIHTTLDNHSRTTDHTSTSNKSDNFSVMAMKMIEMLLKSKGIKNVIFNFSKGDYNYTTINGAGILMFHGDSVRSYKAYSSSQVAKVQDMCLYNFDKTAKHMINGHQHTSIVCDNQYGGKCIQNGSTVGNNEYGTTSGFLPIVPTQTIFFVNELGNIENVKVVNLQHIKE